MSLPHWSDRPLDRPPHGAGGSPRAGAAPRVEWDEWLRVVERKRRALSRGAGGDRLPLALPPDFVHAATRASFRLEGLSATDDELLLALAPGAAGKACRSRVSQRIRNHVAVLRHVEQHFRRARPLRPETVIRWYTSISCGLSTTAFDESTLHRLDRIVTHVNSPQMRLRPAVEDVAHLHHRLLTEPFVPAFNGILARLLLHYHLGRCGLPIVLFDADVDRTPFPDEAAVLRRIMTLVARRYDDMLAA